MTKRRVIGVLLAAVLSFAASSLWYSPMLFGSQFVSLSGVTANAAPEGGKIAAEILRNLLLAFAISWLIARLQTGRLSESLRFAAMMWLGFNRQKVQGRCFGVVLGDGISFPNEPVQVRFEPAR